MIRFLVLALLFFVAARLLRRFMQAGGGSPRDGSPRDGAPRGGSHDRARNGGGRTAEGDRYPDAIDADFEDMDHR